MSELVTFTGGCHCGRVQFEVLAPADFALDDCNCSICFKTGFLHLIVPAGQFKLLSDPNDVSLYQFGSKVAQHYFCRHCGIKSYYIPRSHPDGVSVNARCLNEVDLSEHEIRPFDGQNWEKNHHKLAAAQS